MEINEKAVLRKRSFQLSTVFNHPNATESILLESLKLAESIDHRINKTDMSKNIHTYEFSNVRKKRVWNAATFKSSDLDFENFPPKQHS